MLEIFENFWKFLVEAAPWLLIGFLFAGLLKAFVPSGTILRLVGRGNVRSVLLATFVGIPLPLCSCGVIPTGMALHKQGAARAATLAFLIATPAITVTAILITVGLLGWKFALSYIITAVAVALITGLLGLVLLKDRVVANSSGQADGCCECSGDDCGIEGAGGANGRWPVFKSRVRETLRYGFVDMVEDLGHWILIGLAAAAVVAALIPQSFIGDYLGGGLFALLIMAVVATPIYICSTASVPFVAALIAGGMDPAAGLVFLILGPATNVSTVLVVGRTMGKSTVALYLISILVLSITIAQIFGLSGWL